ncbi:MAG: antibiotic biosynthesis monooxygenase [Deltaproteobacteria bacterium]|nr:antibiotic biosynthesis monooxygenase [Deltaproteobacteria bacterium]
MIGIIAKLPIKEGMEDEFIAAFKELKVEVAKDKGALAYSLNKVNSEPNVFYIVERYEDQEAVKLHGSTDHFKAFNAKVPPFLAGRPEIIMLEEIDSI